MAEKLKILIVEDREENIGAAKEYFENIGFELDFAQTGNEALEKLGKERENYLFLISDLSLPREKGGKEEFIGFEIGKKAEELGIPYVFATSFNVVNNHNIIPYENFEEEYNKFYNGNPKHDCRIIGLNKKEVMEWKKVYENIEELGILKNAEEIREARRRYKKYTGKSYKKK
ncbi:MAG: response regulator [Candidatus Pacearchaeota archaeon]